MTAPDTPQLPTTTSVPPKRLHVKTYGCQMNVYDSERMADVLRPLGYVTTDRPEDADMVVLNTCHIREKAAEKVYSELGRLKEIRAERLAAGAGRSTIVVAGCVAQAEGAEIMARQPAVDLVVGPQAYHQLPELIARGARARGERLLADFAPEAKFDALPVARAATGVTAFLTVQEGCDKFCAFCVVPYTRGPEWSRPAAAVLAEARGLAAQGVREVTLLGQNVNAYAGEAPRATAGGAGTWSLARLVRELAQVDGLARIRFTTSHPNDMADDLVAAFGDTPALMPYLHLPVQSGADRVLRAMNRRHTSAHYLALVERLRAARPDLALTSDFIVGFPGETDADFAATLRLAEAVGYAGAFTFKYSRRPGTPASALPGQVEEAVKAERLAALNALVDRDRKRFDAAQLGRTLPVLWEKPGRQAGQVIGRSPYLQAVWAQAPATLIGAITPVEVVGLSTNSLEGRLADAAATPISVIMDAAA